MRAVVLALLLVSPLGPSSCLQLGTPDAADGGVTNSTPSGNGDAAVAGPSGSDCVSLSGVTLCTRISLCPSVAVDHDLYPDCGFRIPASAVELDCMCGDFLCPIGAALTCGQAQGLLASQSEVAACTQLSDGRCARIGPSNATDGGACDRTCLAGCAEDPLCIRLCGC